MYAVVKRLHLSIVMPPPQKTRFFHSCLGVFQGGGCRAAALVGAYDKAIQWGVQFTEFAGTSAGSIVAVLAGAGATPTQITSFVRQLDFIKLLREAELVEEPGWMIRSVWPKRYRTFRDLLFNQGFHSSSGIEEWVEKCLRGLNPLRNNQGVQSFRSLDDGILRIFLYLVMVLRATG